MSFREWIRAELEGGPRGTLDIETPARSQSPTLAVLLRGIIAIGLIAVVAGLLAQRVRPVYALGGIVAYLVVAFFVLPRPRLDNLGPRPLRWIDDDNRALLVLRIVLWPGRYVSAGLRDALRSAVEAATRDREA